MSAAQTTNAAEALINSCASIDAEDSCKGEAKMEEFDNVRAARWVRVHQVGSPSERHYKLRCKARLEWARPRNPNGERRRTAAEIAAAAAAAAAAAPAAKALKAGSDPSSALRVIEPCISPLWPRECNPLNWKD